MFDVRLAVVLLLCRANQAVIFRRMERLSSMERQAQELFSKIQIRYSAIATGIIRNAAVSYTFSFPFFIGEEEGHLFISSIQSACE
jgi:hypothetical protein